MHNESMPNVMIRNLPEGVHAELSRRAAAKGQSLQQFLSAELARLAAAPTLESLFERVSRHTDGRVGLEQAVHDLDADRAR